ncbi:DUF2169 domain-containing protein [Caballeronia novacaledonica]|uniref:DUF2169 domain-containing protein n=1 Tax=Caballeronia novacaledonica TaxID=1544861 RepID=A0AA37IN74_9BURK|nr:DUF2169 domain-containing protein [Caballeronia novacaledonica]GJH29936.1 DUF2169 domain-containing protein [Caballeronia novacaledonica]
MELINQTGFEADWSLGFQRNGRELAIIVAKATFSLPSDENAAPELPPAARQVPLTGPDEFTGTPGYSAVLHETDFAHFKSRCDVLFNGSAHGPHEQPEQSVVVGLKVGAMCKSLRVVGDRLWAGSRFHPRPDAPIPFVSKPISYDVAFGGMHEGSADGTKPYCLRANPVGRGYHPDPDAAWLRQTLLPNTEEVGRPVRSPSATYRPMSLGAIGRNFAERAPLAGTFDQHWLDNVAPFWPDDFRYEYFQCAPSDQRIDYPKGGEPVVLRNLTRGGLLRFVLPTLDLSVLASRYRGNDAMHAMAIDTIFIEPAFGHMTMTCRVAIPMARSLFDLRRLIVGETPKLRIALRSRGKPHYASPKAFLEANPQFGARR